MPAQGRAEAVLGVPNEIDELASFIGDAVVTVEPTFL